MAERLSLFSLQIAAALSGIICCGPSAEAQMIMPCYRLRWQQQRLARHLMERYAGENGMRLHSSVLSGL